MSIITRFLTWLQSNKDALTLIGGAVAAISAGGWALFKYRRERTQSPKSSQTQAGASTPEDKSFVTQLTVWAEIDADIYVDGQKLMTINHYSGFDYAGARVRITPESVLAIKARGVEKSRRLWELCPSHAEKCEIRVGSAQLCDISLTEAERRASMGSSLDVPALLQEIRQNARHLTRAWAIERLGHIGDARAKESLIEALEDPDPWVQASAARALGRMADATALPSLKAAFARYQHKDRYGYLFEGAIKDLEFV